MFHTTPNSQFEPRPAPRDRQMVDRGRFLEEEVAELFLGHTHPTRNLDQNLSDLRAQIAANEAGIKDLHKARSCLRSHFRLHSKITVRSLVPFKR